MFCSKKPTKKINLFTKDLYGLFESPYSLLLEEAHQLTFHQRCIDSLMVEVYKDLNDIFKLREKMHNLCTNCTNLHIFHTENPLSLKYGLDVVPYRASQLCQQVTIVIREADSLALFKIA